MRRVRVCVGVRTVTSISFSLITHALPPTLGHHAGAGAAAEQQPLPSDPRALLGEVDKALGNLTPLIKAEG